MVATQKLRIVQKLNDLLSQNQNFVLIKINKTSHQHLEELRKILKKTGSGVKVFKNSLFEKSLNKLATTKKNFSSLLKDFIPLKDTNALMTLGQEWNVPLSEFYKFIKKDETLSFNFGLIENQTYDSVKLLQIAQLPGKDILAGKIISSMKTPASKLVYSLKFNPTKLVFILKEKSKKTN